MKKQDINGVRSAQDLERKYDLKSILELKENFELQKNGLNKVENELNEFVIATTNNLQEIQSQVDGNITTWFLSGVPTLNNEPTVNWNTIEEKNNHLGDLYYDKETGYSYRFTVANEVYEWIKLTDSDITEALAIANSAKDTADSKRRVFVVQPTTPYDVGDLWIKDEELYRCQTTKDKEETFENNDWIVATKYTDDTVANQVGENLTILSGTVTEIKKDVDKLDTTMTNTTELVNEQGEKVGILEEKQSQTTQTVNDINTSVTQINNRIENIIESIEVFFTELEPDLVLIPTFENGLPKISTEYFVNYGAKLEDNEVVPIVTTTSQNEGITLSITDKLTFSVNSSVAIPNKDNKYELLFTYTKEEKVYSKTMIIYLMRVNENEDLTERLDQVEKDLNNNYSNNDELEEKLESQKATIIEETSTMINQSTNEVTTSIINKINTDGVTTLKNTLVTIDINGINVAKNDEDVVSLLDNKGLYVSDGKLKEDESNLLMITDRSGAYFKSATIDGTIKEQGLFQKEIIEDEDFGKGQASYYIGG